MVGQSGAALCLLSFFALVHIRMAYDKLKLNETYCPIEETVCGTKRHIACSGHKPEYTEKVWRLFTSFKFTYINDVSGKEK